MRNIVVASTVFGASVLRAWSSKPGWALPQWSQVVCAMVGSIGSVNSSSTYNSSFLVVILLAKVLQTVLFGPLRVDEIERLMGQTWYTLVEFGVAFVVVGEPLTARFLATVCIFMLLKWFHCLSSSRVEESDAAGSKLAFVLGLLHCADILWMKHYYGQLITAKQVMINTVFAVELSVLYSGLVATSVHFLLNLTQPSQSRKRTYLYIVNIGTDILKLLMYMGFSMVMLSNYCVPLHIFREAYLTLRFVIQKARALIWHRHLVGQYDISAFDGAVASDIEHTPSCVICRDIMALTDSDESSCYRPIKIQCGHVVHYGCLFEWLQRSCCCPTCRCKI
jgi:E3 ubiquitin-protein ligase synoviolin